MKSDLNKESSKHLVRPLFFENLISCPIGKNLRVEKVNVGRHAKIRLACLGIIPRVEIIKKKAAPFHGPVEIIVKGASLVIGRGLAAKILVKRI
ncbi:MAG: ferrous iron transport protein A [Promethearchaeota archaeon]